MEWEAAGIVLSVSPFGEADALVTVLTADQGAHKGLVRGGLSRRSAGAAWDVGNVVRVRWVARVAEQLGTLSGECLRAPASLLLDSRLELAAILSACAVADGSLPERVACPRTYEGLLELVGGLATRRRGLAELVRWEASLLAELGFGLDLSACAVSGEATDLRFVSPRSGRAVSEAGAGVWRERLLRLPPCLLDARFDEETSLEDLCDGLALTGHFLARDAFGQRHRPVPAARDRLLGMLIREAGRQAPQGRIG